MIAQFMLFYLAFGRFFGSARGGFCPVGFEFEIKPIITGDSIKCDDTLVIIGYLQQLCHGLLGRCGPRTINTVIKHLHAHTQAGIHQRGLGAIFLIVG